MVESGNTAGLTPAAHLRMVFEAAVGAYRPSSARFVVIKGWFGPKWLGFCGKALGAISRWSTDEAIVPPFHPNRVCAEFDVAPSPDGPTAYSQSPAVDPLHGERRSETNLRLRLPAATPHGTLAAWLSAPQPADSVASLMVYLVRPDAAPLQWYLQARKSAAGLDQTPVGITVAELMWLLARADLRTHTTEQSPAANAVTEP